MISLPLGDYQCSVVEVYCTDVAHEGEFPGTYADACLRFPADQGDAVWRWLVDVANGIDDEVQAAAPGEWRRELVKWRTAAESLSRRVLRAMSISEK